MFYGEHPLFLLTQFGEFITYLLTYPINYHTNPMKIKLLATLLLLTICIKGKSQSKKFNFGLQVFPNYSLSLLSNDGNTSKETEESVRENETWKPSISTNVFASYLLRENISVSLGVGYQNNGEKLKNGSPTGDRVDPRKGFIYQPHPSITRTETFIHHNIEIPVLLKYHLNKKFFATAGFSTIYQLTTISKVTYDNHETGEKSIYKNEDEWMEYRNMNFSGNLGFGMNCLANDKMIFFVQPNVQYSFLGISKDASLNRHPFSIGLVLGIEI